MCNTNVTTCKKLENNIFCKNITYSIRQSNHKDKHAEKIAINIFYLPVQNKHKLIHRL